MQSASNIMVKNAVFMFSMAESCTMNRIPIKVNFNARLLSLKLELISFLAYKKYFYAKNNRLFSLMEKYEKEGTPLKIPLGRLIPLLTDIEQEAVK